MVKLLSPLAAKLLARLRAIDTKKTSVDEAMSSAASRELSEVLIASMKALRERCITLDECKAITKEANFARRKLQLAQR
jgi:hypothetical protein